MKRRNQHPPKTRMLETSGGASKLVLNSLSSEPGEQTHAKDCNIQLLKCSAVCSLLGGIHPRTLHRLEKRGLIRCVPGLLRHKLYSQADVINLIKTLKDWKA